MNDHQQAGASVALVGHVRVMMSAVSIVCCRSSGAGGQHVNTTDSAVILRIPLWGIIGLNKDARQRLCRLAGQRLNNQEVLSLRCDDERSQHDNRNRVWDRLRELVTQALKEPKKRYRTKPTRGSVERRIKSKKNTSAKKQRRRDNDDDWDL